MTNDFYCESCFEEDLKTWLELSTGTIVCSEKCADDWHKVVEQEVIFQEGLIWV